MSWAFLPDNLIEKIVGFALDIQDISEVNAVPWAAYQYGRVCVNWNAAILGTSNEFKRKYMNVSLDPDSLGSRKRALARDGFLAATYSLDFGWDTPPQLICDHADGNSIEHFYGKLKLYEDNVSRMINIITLSQKARTFELCLTSHAKIETQREVELLWKLLQAMTRCNEKAKTIKCTVDFALPKYEDFYHDEYLNPDDENYPYIPDWSFTHGDDAKSGSVERLELYRWEGYEQHKSGQAESPNWSSLAANIGQVIINYGQLNFIRNMKAQCLRLEDIYQSYGYPRYGISI